jgi:hypothetical protein
MNMTSTDDTPDLFKKWSAISLVAGALERRVWTVVGSRGGRPRNTYPNLYIFLVGAPGVGKLTVQDVQELWQETMEPGTNIKALQVAENNLTKASLIDRLMNAARSFLPKEGSPYEYNALAIAAEEFGVFLRTYDLDFISVLNMVYNNPEAYSEMRRYGPARDVNILRPMFNILAGVQPGWMATVFPEEAWSMGLTSRIIMVYGNSSEPRDPFTEGLDRPLERRRLLTNLGKLSMLHGPIGWSKPAMEKVTAWHVSNGKPTPTHSKLEHYCRRRTLHVIKLSLVSAVSRTNRVSTIEEIDVERAINWLVEAERLMPDIFRSMIGRSDHQIIEELYAHVVALYNTTKGPLHEQRLFSFLLQRVPSDKINHIIAAAERSGMIARVGGTENYVPKIRTEFVE